MTISRLIVFLFLISPLLFAQSPAPSPKEVIYLQEKDTLVIQRLEQSKATRKELSTRNQGKSKRSKNEPKPEETSPEFSPAPAKITFIISTIAIEKRGTRFRIWPSHLGSQSALEGWSNIDWSLFQGKMALNEKKSPYQFLLFHSARGHGGELPKVPSRLPKFAETGARYLVTSPLEMERESTLDFLEAIHVLYDEETHRLRRDRRKLVKEQQKRKRQLAREARKPKTRVLKVWRHDLSEEK